MFDEIKKGLEESYKHREVDGACCVICGREKLPLALHVIKFYHADKYATPEKFVPQSHSRETIRGGVPICNKCCAPCQKCKLPIATPWINRIVEKLQAEYPNVSVSRGNGYCRHIHLFRYFASFFKDFYVFKSIKTFLMVLAALFLALLIFSINRSNNLPTINKAIESIVSLWNIKSNNDDEGTIIANEIDIDQKKNFAQYLEEAEKGNVGSQEAVASMFATGNGVEKNYKEAFYWYEKAAGQGNPTAQYYLSMMYGKGIGVEKDITQAIIWLKQASDNGSIIASSTLGQFYLEGMHVQQDYKKAYSLLEMAAENGDADAQFSLSRMYMKGNGVMQSAEKDLYWTKKAAEQNHPAALVSLGLKYQMGGDGVKRDDKKAFQLIKLSAEKGHYMGQYQLGCAYADGVGVEKDLKKAYIWLSVATTTIGPEYDYAKTKRDDVAKMISESELKLAQKEAAILLDKIEKNNQE